MDKLHVIDHPLIAHKLTIMRDKRTGSKDFRQLLDEIAMLMGYEVTRDLPIKTISIETPLTRMDAPYIMGKKLARSWHGGRTASSGSRGKGRTHRYVPRRGNASAC